MKLLNLFITIKLSHKRMRGSTCPPLQSYLGKLENVRAKLKMTFFSRSH